MTKEEFVAKELSEWFEYVNKGRAARIAEYDREAAEELPNILAGIEMDWEDYESQEE